MIIFKGDDMMVKAQLNDQGQITIPKRIKDKFNIKPNETNSKYGSPLIGIIDEARRNYLTVIIIQISFLAKYIFTTRWYNGTLRLS